MQRLVQPEASGESEVDLSRSLAQLGPWDRHKLLLQQGMPSGAALASLVPKSDADFLREHHEFIRGDGGAVAADSTWGERLAAHYYSKLLKEYALCDLSRYKEGKVGLRWRTSEEVVVGKGQFTCAALACSRSSGLQSFELPFAYQEKGEKKQALVKVRVCSKCATKLYWNKQHELDKLRALVRSAHKDKRSRGHSHSRSHGRNHKSGSESKEQRHKRHCRSRSDDIDQSSPCTKPAAGTHLSDDKSQQHASGRGNDAGTLQQPEAVTRPQTWQGSAAGDAGKQGGNADTGAPRINALLDEMLA